eukprot:250674-Rhodomonas_salina.8
MPRKRAVRNTAHGAELRDAQRRISTSSDSNARATAQSLGGNKLRGNDLRIGQENEQSIMNLLPIVCMVSFFICANHVIHLYSAAWFKTAADNGLALLNVGHLPNFVGAFLFCSNWILCTSLLMALTWNEIECGIWLLRKPAMDRPPFMSNPLPKVIQVLFGTITVMFAIAAVESSFPDKTHEGSRLSSALVHQFIVELCRTAVRSTSPCFGFAFVLW